MYRGFNLIMKDLTDEKFFKIGQELFNEDKVEVEKNLKHFTTTNGSLNGSKMKEDWFPLVNADIFLSHSHKDKKTAIVLAGWLYELFNIKVFIDSCIWGYADDLLRILDKRYCLNPNGKAFNYSKRNFSTSHIHMMLSTALAMMIDKTECLFFLNTPSSISCSDTINKVESPWIYAEITLSQVVQKKIPQRRQKEEIKNYLIKGIVNEDLRIQFEVSLKHLTDINADSLINWKKIVSRKNPNDALDNLYDLNPIVDLINLNG